MTTFLLLCFAAGVVGAVPAWIGLQRVRARQGWVDAKRFDPRDAVVVEIEPVVLNGRLLPEADHVEEATR
ncbi:hypothetical protein [Trinickia fusca]|uniref:Uncharacterized protein n=1 Tax=Trinickia fusca TaxID=2419777 RepID=A0A494X3G6_9BURK|nr:hypothetical protein [Trinickia fusca]RKP45235.1 hypothetical protein D7S89_20635 [Trinickia fusca]